MNRLKFFLFSYLFCGLLYSNLYLCPPKGFNDLKKIIEKNSLQDLQTYFKKYETKKVVNYIENNGLNLLHTALAHTPQNKEIIKFLLDNGADPNKRLLSTNMRYALNQGNFYKGWSAAHIAVSLNSPIEILNLIHKNDGDFFLKDDDDFMPAELAFRYARTEIIQWMHKKSFDFKKLKKHNCIKNTEPKSRKLYFKYVKNN